jgi:hypothetical protein
VVLRGEAGVGKSALLDYLFDRVAGWQVARAAGVESEMELPMPASISCVGPCWITLSSCPSPSATP